MKRDAKGGNPGSPGVTLLELLLVMAVLGIVLGAGVGMFATLDLGQRQARGLVKNILRSAQNSATARQAPARVRIDVESGAITAEAMQVIGTWHFERNRWRGAFNLEGTPNGAADLDPDGFIGSAAAFDGVKGSYVEVPVENEPSFDFSAGFSIECAARREPAGGQVVVVGDVAAIEIDNGGTVRGWFVPRIEDKGQPKQGERVLVASEPGLAPTGTWVRIKLEYDRHTLALYVDGVPAASVDEDVAVWPIEKPMYVSGRRYPFHGAIDNVVIGAVVAEETVELPESVKFSGDTPREINFAAGGGLDRDRHPEPLLVTLEYDDGSTRVLFVGTYGTVDG